MQWQHTLPPLGQLPPGLVVVQANAGRSRERALRDWVEGLGAGAYARVLRCDARRAGAFTGLDDLVADLLPELDAHAPDLLAAHAIELSAVLPGLGARLAPAQALTDTSVGDEAVRSYAVDRAYRIAHGLVDLLGEVQHRFPRPRWVLVCDGVERAGVLARRFFAELLRRRGRELGLTLVAVVPRGVPPEGFPPAESAAVVRLDVPADRPAPPQPAEATSAALELEAHVGGDLARWEEHVWELIGLWDASDRPRRAHRWRAFALGRYNHRGYYEDALALAEPVLANLDAVVTGTPPFTRWAIVGSVVQCLILVGQPERAYRVAADRALAHAAAPDERARVLYVLAMLHARFLPERDLDAAERLLAEALGLLESPGIPHETRHFLTVFMNNGIALVRHRQGRAAEAMELCREGHRRLEANLAEERHRLERTVLLHNISQVHAAAGSLEEAIRYLTLALEVDPNYSEYRNERGSHLLHLGRVEEAVADYREAIRLSPPYPEVWTNLAQCYRKMGRPHDAVEAYSRAIDLDPGAVVALGSRARVLEALGRPAEALADYDAALAADCAQPLLRANRAALRYAAGRVGEAAEDLDAAVALMPTNPALYRNRALALRDLGRTAEAAADLRTYLRLVPAAPDAEAVAAQAAALDPRPAAV